MEESDSADYWEAEAKCKFPEIFIEWADTDAVAGAFQPQPLRNFAKFTKHLLERVMVPPAARTS